MDCDCFAVPARHVAAAFYAASGGGGGAGGLGVRVDGHAAGECGALSKDHKSCILLWMGGGPPTIDMWDMKPGAPTAGRVQADLHRRAMCRSASRCRCGQADEAPVDRALDEHARGGPQARPLLHAHGLRAEPERRASELRLGGRARAGRREEPTELEIPPFVSVGGASEGPGFLGMAYAPFQVDANGQRQRRAA